MSLRELDARDSFHGLSCTHVYIPLLSIDAADYDLELELEVMLSLHFCFVSCLAFSYRTAG